MFDTRGSSAGRDSLVAGLRWRGLAVTRDIVARIGLLGHIQRLRKHGGNRRRSEQAMEVVPSIIAGLRAGAGTTDSATWRVNKVMPTGSDIVFVWVGPAELPSAAMIKIAETPKAAEGLRWQVGALAALEGDPRLGEWRELLPQILDVGEVAIGVYAVETAINGVNLEHTLRDPAAGDAALREAAAAIGPLHHATAEAISIGREQLNRWVRDPIRVLVAATDRTRGHNKPTAPAFERLSAELCAALEGQPISIGWVHGDYCLGNVLMGPDGKVSGIVDWEFARPGDFTLLDIVMLLLTARMYLRRQELGRVVRDLLTTPSWSATESALLATTPDAATWQTIGIDRVVQLCWLRHTAWNLERRTRNANMRLWLHTNIRMVLEALQDTR